MTPAERLIGVEREAPEPLLRALRVIDPTAELLYMGEGRWLLGRLTSIAAIRHAGAELAASCVRATANRKVLTPTDRRRWLFAQARLLGFQPTTEYTVQGEPTAAIVRDQEVMDYLHRTLTDGERDQLADADFVARQAAAEKDLADDARAHDAWRWLFTRQHAVRRLDDPTRNRVRSGRTTHLRVA